MTVIDEHPIWTFLRDDYNLIAKAGNIKVFRKDMDPWMVYGNDEPKRITPEEAEGWKAQEKKLGERNPSIDFIRKHGDRIALFQRSGQFPDNEYEVYSHYDHHAEEQTTWWLIIDFRHVHQLNEDDKDAWVGFAEAAGQREWRC